MANRKCAYVCEFLGMGVDGFPITCMPLLLSLLLSFVIPFEQQNALHITFLRFCVHSYLNLEEEESGKWKTKP